jgi:hypothetical protein
MAPPKAGKPPNREPLNHAVLFFLTLMLEPAILPATYGTTTTHAIKTATAQTLDRAQKKGRPSGG